MGQKVRAREASVLVKSSASGLKLARLQFLDLCFSAYRILENYLTALSLMCNMEIIMVPSSQGL